MVQDASLRARRLQPATLAYKREKKAREANRDLYDCRCKLVTRKSEGILRDWRFLFCLGRAVRCLRSYSTVTPHHMLHQFSGWVKEKAVEIKLNVFRTQTTLSACGIRRKQSGPIRTICMCAHAVRPCSGVVLPLHDLFLGIYVLHYMTQISAAIPVLIPI